MSDINIVLENRDDIRVAVEEKDINVEVPAGKDGRSLRPRGEWNASVAYAYLDLVGYQGSSYVATRAVPAGTLPTDTSYWMLLAEKGEPGGAVWGNISGDLSDQTDLQTALDAKADVIISSASGSIASFSDGSASPVTALSVGIEPVQDLHGYDNPWPAGGGKNKFDVSTVTNQMLNISNGQSGDNVNWRASDFIPMVEGSVTLTWESSSNYFQANLCCYDSTKTFISDSGVSASKIGYSNTFAVVSGTAYIRFSYSVVVSGSDVPRNNIRLNIGTSDLGYQPYSNICPISGHTSATVTRTGKNLLPITTDFLESGSIDGVHGTDSSATNRVRTKGLFPFPYDDIVEKGYTLTIPSNYNIALRFYDADGNYIYKSSSVTGWVTNLCESEYLHTGIKYARFVFRKSDNSNINVSDIVGLAYQLELGSTATAYEAPQIQTVTIDLDGTRYGGVVDVLTGEMSVDRAYVDLGTLTWNKHTLGTFYALNSGQKYNPAELTCSALKTFTSNYILNDYDTYPDSIIGMNNSSTAYLYVKCTTYATPADFKTAMTGQTVVYPLATPLTVQLSPSTMQTLLGINNIWADTGDIAVEYRADTKLFVQGQIAQTAKVTRQMIADSATADGKAPKSLATGDLIIVGDELRKATANIGNGSAITASNSTTATLADVIKALQ